MATVHARSWRATYSGLLPDAVIDDVVNSRAARMERWRVQLGQTEELRGSFVGTMKGRVVEFVFWGSDHTTKTAEVHAIYVDPSAIGRGIGRALLDASVAAMAANGFSAAELWVLDVNEPARRFYEAAGWSADGETKAEDRAGGTLHEVRYRRPLTAIGPEQRVASMSTAVYTRRSRKFWIALWVASVIAARYLRSFIPVQYMGAATVIGSVVLFCLLMAVLIQNIGPMARTLKDWRDQL
jgi:GNAT superfamily N-acetyltransferase